MPAEQFRTLFFMQALAQRRHTLLSLLFLKQVVSKMADSATDQIDESMLK
jgi:hypothetical protein